MKTRTQNCSRLLVILLLSVELSLLSLTAGVRREIQNEYILQYKNRAMFLKIPVRGFRQTIAVGPNPGIDRSNANQPVSFKVGEQVRITDLKFDDTSILFRIAATDLSRESEIIFRFSGSISNDFLEKRDFDAALALTFTQGLSYTEIDSAKEDFIKGQFDDLIQQFATATGTTTDYVVKTISEKNPEYRQARSDAREAKARQQELEQQWRDEAKTRKEAETELTSVRRDLSQARTALASARDERGQLVGEKAGLQKEVAQLQARNQDYDRQVNDLLKTMGVQADTRANLGKRVEAVTRSFDSLKSERSDLSQKLGQVTKELDSLRASNSKLTDDLKQVEQRNSKLAAELHSLTSDRNSLEARYIKTRREREILENAGRLTQALHVQNRREQRDKLPYDVVDVFLLTKKIATLEVQVPSHVGQSARASFLVLSPDTVEFTTEERELYQLLGDKFKVQTDWKTEGESLKPVGSSPALQEVNTRDRAEWSWQLAGDITEAHRIDFLTQMVNRDGQKISLSSHQFWVYPAGRWDNFRRSFAPLSFGLGILLGMAVLSVVWLLRGHRVRAANGRAVREPEYVAPKRL
jgi:predicted nuclease with TOPRIM domain